MQAVAIETPKTAPCGLYLVLPENWMEPEFLRHLGGLFRAINASAYERNNHVIELRVQADAEYSDEDMERIVAMSELTKSQGINFIIGGDIALAEKCKADGILLDSISDVRVARARLGNDPIIGMRCGASRMKADQALEAGADYVSFGDASTHFADPAIVQWWNMKTDHPCLVEGPITNDDCAFYVQAGAYFIEASNYVWNHPKGVMQGVVNMTHAIDLAAGVVKNEGTVQ
jgi:thiamine-phosphate pyrophosphorylase